ncbi:DNA-binding response regulator [marine bacterium AO1-C]|nr:DNA-binding response regulator [marine bacterium AO1-C]
MKKIRCIIVDDEKLARTLLENYIQKLPQLTLVQSCKSPLEALECLQSQQIDLMFLDIQMPDLTGIELLQSLPNKPVVIFTTAYAEYALEGYQLDVIDYLLKPFSFNRFVQGVNKATQQIDLQKGGTGAAKPVIVQAAPTKESKSHLIIKAEHKTFKVKFGDIVYIKSVGEYVTYYIQDTPQAKGQQIMTLQSLRKLEDEILPPDQFIRIHRSYIVAIDQVQVLEGNELVIGQERLPIGKTYREEVMKRVFGGK